MKRRCVFGVIRYLTRLPESPCRQHFRAYLSEGAMSLTSKGVGVRVRVRFLLGVVAWAAVAASQVGCADNSDARQQANPTPTAAVASGPSIPDPLATIGAEKITLANVRARMGDQLDQLEIQYRRERDKLIGGAVDTIIHSRLLEAESKRTGKTEDQLVASEISGSIEPSDSEIKAWFNDNQARLGGRTLDQVRSQIAAFLRNQHRAEAATKLEDRLRAEHRVRVAFEPYRLQFRNDRAPALGRKMRRSRWSSSPIFSARIASSPHRRSKRLPGSLAIRCRSFIANTRLRVCTRSRSRQLKRRSARTTRASSGNCTMRCLWIKPNWL